MFARMFNMASLSRYFGACLALACSTSFHAQINGYAKVTAITNGSVLTCNSVNQTFGSFTASSNIVIMQMQNATYATSNNSGFGAQSSLGASGIYEVARISAVNGSATSMTLTQALNNTYDPTDAVQIITYPNLGTNFTTTANISGVAWTGSVGGVIAFSVTGNLILNHNISANAIGFRGGAKSGQDGGSCETNTWRTNTGNAKYAAKGEGVAITTSNNHRAGRAKLVNGGGGGIVHNGGGGGGGNYTAGGDGYYGYVGGGYCSATTNAGGQGGEAVASSATRVFMGGGGGGGQENNSVGTNGGIGGGIILIKCDTIVRPSSCSARTISANGETASNAGNDGCGGGGAGGSIVLDIKGMRFTSTCSLSIQANGGNGGSVNSGGSAHGAGGGGGQCAIYIRATAPFANVTLSTNNGAGGNGSTDPSPPTAGSGSGSAGAGVNSGQSAIPLPITLMSFELQKGDNGTNVLVWKTANEKDNLQFTLQHSYDGNLWETLCIQPGKINSTSISTYQCTHAVVSEGVHYYRLLQEDTDGTTKTVGIVSSQNKVKFNQPFVAPNPASELITLYNAKDLAASEFYMTNAVGQSQIITGWLSNDYKLLFDISAFEPGTYILRGGNYSFKVIIIR